MHQPFEPDSRHPQKRGKFGAVGLGNCRAKPTLPKLEPQRQSVRFGSLRIVRHIAVVFFYQLRTNIVQLLHDRVV